MATAVTTQKLRAKHAIEMWDHDPGTASALITSPDGGTTKRYVAMKNYERFFAAAMATVIAGGGTGITLIEIVAAEDSSGTNITVILASAAIQADAQGDWACLEVTAEQIIEVGKAAGYAFTHVGLRITCNNSGDEAAVLYVRSGAKFPQDALTAATTIA